MMSAKILIYAISDDETVASLQLRIEKDTNIPAANQELLLEAGLVLEANALASQCAVDYMVIFFYITAVSLIRSTNFDLLFHFPLGGRWTTDRLSSCVSVRLLLLHL